MALDPEQMRQRRMEKQQQRQAQHRKTMIKLAIAGVVLLLCAVLIVIVAWPNGGGENVAATPSENTAAESEATQETTAEPSSDPTEAPATTVIHLLAAGDFNVTEQVVNSGGANYDYTNMLLDVGPVLAQGDLTVLNFEGNFYGAPYGTDRSAPEAMAKALAKVGVDAVQLANSYSIYKGMEGLASTISAVRSAGMDPLGVYATSQEAKEGKGYTIRNVRGVNIAFVAFTKGMDGMALPVGNDGCVNVLYKDYATDYQEVDTEGITKILKAVAKEKPDLTVAMLHWGSEFNDTISTSQQKICSLMKENGVDAIIGTHAHYVQKMEFDQETGQFVAYSLGDFAGDAARAGSEYSVILDLEITKDNETRETKITGYTYTPIFISAQKGKPVRVLRIHEAMKAFESNYIDRVTQAEYDAMVYALGRIEARIAGE